MPNEVMKIGELIPLEVKKLQAIENEKLTWHQKSRKAKNMPYHGGVSAQVYVSVHKSGEVGYDSRIAYAVDIPEGMDLSESGIQDLLAQIRTKLDCKIANTSPNLLIVNCTFEPALDSVGHSLNGPSVALPLELEACNRLTGGQDKLAAPIKQLTDDGRSERS